MSENQTNASFRQEDSLNIKDLMLLYLSKWRWFLLSLAVCIGLAVVYLLRTPSVYTRTATLLIEDNDKGGSISASEMSFADLGLFQSNTNVNNEIIAMSSPALMQDVVRRLHLDMTYSADGRFHDEVLYGSTLPVTVALNEFTDGESASLTMYVDTSGAVSLYDFRTVLNGENVRYKDVVQGKVGETVETPLGGIVVNPTAFFHRVGSGMEITVSKSTLYGATTAYSSKLTVSLLQKEATVVSLSMKDVSVQRAVDVLNTLISAYNESWVSAKNQIAVSTSAFIDDRLRVIEHELGAVEEDISSYKSKNLIPDLQASSDLYIQQSSETEVKLLELSNRMYMVRYISDYMSREENAFELLPAGTGIESTGIEEQILEYNNKLLERNYLVASSSTSNPLVVDADQALQSMRATILTSLENYTVMLQNQMESLRQQESKATDRIAATPDQAKYLLSVERQQKVKESLYLFLLQKREENELSQAFTAYNTRLITPPVGSIAPTSPARMQILLIAFVLGLVIPMGVFFLKENGNTRLRGRKDLESMSVPYVGEIPMCDGKKSSIRYRLRNLTRRGAKNDDVEVVVKEGVRNVVNEAFRVVRTNLEFMHVPSSGHVYMTTSFNPGSGKTFVTVNVAVSLAIRGRKVLVVDGDMRRATASRLLHSPSIGISDWLSGRETDMDRILFRTDIHENLWMMPVGTIPPNPTELLQDGRLKELFDALKDSFDYIFIDCPPINIVADTQIISKVADRTVFIVRAGLLERSMLPELEADFRDGRYPGLCMVLNGTVSKGGRYGYSYGYSYGYGYYHQS
mgnify:FL=1